MYDFHDGRKASAMAIEDLFPTTAIQHEESIRKWGCGLTDTPFIFVHIGKAGGGFIRRQVALSAVNYTRSKTAWHNSMKDSSYYPIRADNGTLIGKASFCNSGHKHHMPLPQKTYEGTQTCTASTPIGQALTCPAYSMNCNGDPRDTESAQVVYLGHNGLGNEIHWLPVPYLQHWWQQHWAIAEDHRDIGNVNHVVTISDQWQRLDPTRTWCGGMHRPWQSNMSREEERNATECGKQIQADIDRVAFATIQKHMAMNTSKDRGRAWSAVYASLPLIRVVMIRNPFSWLASKFSWSNLAKKGVICDNVTDAIFGAGHHDMYKGVQGNNRKNQLLVHGFGAPGWARRFSLEYIYLLCGSDCWVRHLQQQATIKEVTAQAESNLRHAFSVVGILEDGEETFFNMIHKRVDYMKNINNNNISNLVMENLTYGLHASGSRREKGRCKDRFNDIKFQQELIAASPEVASLVHLYNVAVEVNQFQKRELEQCKT